MRILALYDIHGNLDALDAVLADPRAAEPDLVVVGGDVVPGPLAGATLDRLRGLPVPVRWVRGNGEREVAEAVGTSAGGSAGGGSAGGGSAGGGSAGGGQDLARLTAALSAAELGDEAARALGDLPLTLVADGVLFCHASPRRDDELLTRLSPPERWAAALAGAGAATVVAGHTHQQDDRRVGDTRFLNAGSVGLPYEGDGDARWLWLTDGVPELRRTAYDAAAAGRRMLQAGWPDPETIEAALIEPIPADVVTRLFEERAGET